jgi:hypothetical protein
MPFWASEAPKFSTDHLSEVTVFWEKPSPETNMVEVMAWSTTNRNRLLELESNLKMKSWRSLSILCVSHPTRIILTTQSRQEWEIHMLGSGQEMDLALYDRNNVGRSGAITGAAGFVDALSQMLRADMRFDAKLLTNHRAGKRSLEPRYYSRAVGYQLTRFPEYHAGVGSGGSRVKKGE